MLTGHSRRLVLAPLVCSLVASAAGLRVGRASVSSTPPLGSPVGSSYGLAPSTSIHDDLFAKSIVLEVDGVKAVMVACDLVSIRKEIVAEVRRLIAATTSLRPEHVILSATHCHAGPQMHPMFLFMVPEPARKLGEKYVEELPGKIAEAVRLAEADLRPARVGRL